MELFSLKPPARSRKTRVRLGRGESSGCGKTSGKGNKGQSARSGYSNPAGFEGGQMPLYRRLPKKGFTSKARAKGTNAYSVISLSVLNSFENGTKVTVEMLNTWASSRKRAGVKILAKGTLEKKLTVQANSVSVGAKAAIEALGGTIELV